MRAALGIACLLLVGVAGSGPAAGEPKPKHASITADLDCGACHTAAGWGMAPGGGRGFDHSRTGFPLRGAHQATACTACHEGVRAARSECASCHADAHAGRLGDACAECHGAADWRDTRTLLRHQQTRLPLTGRHAFLECTACHAATPSRSFTNVPADCFACHERDYRRPGIHPNHQGDPANPMAAPLPRTCGQCHRTSGWTPATFNPASLLSGSLLARRAAAPPGHDARFAISFGKHRGGACADCHPVPEAPRVVACTGCHAHDEATVRRRHGGRVVGELGTGCLRCHPGGAGR
jgi:hypothetical protein